MLFYDALTLLGSHVLPTFTQLVAAAVMMTMAVAVMSCAEASEEEFAQNQQSHCLAEAQFGQTEERGHQPVPQQHHTTTAHSGKRHEAQRDEDKVFLKYRHKC